MMRRDAQEMNWKNIIPVLTKGVKMSVQGHHMDPWNKTRYASPISKIAYDSARSTNQMEIAGLGQDTTSGIIEQFKTGELFPDQVVGISTKSILVALLVMMILKSR